MKFCTMFVVRCPNEYRKSQNFTLGETNLRCCCLFSSLFFYLFPFNVVFNENMVIMAMGTGLKTIMDDAYGKAVDEVFTLIKPPISFTFANVRTSRWTMFHVSYFPSKQGGVSLRRYAQTQKKHYADIVGYESSVQ